MSNPNQRKINIPTWLIVLSFVFGIWPVGIALIVLKIFGESSGSEQKSVRFSATDGQSSAAGKTTNTAGPVKKQKKFRQKHKALKYLGLIASGVTGGVLSILALANLSIPLVGVSLFFWLCFVLCFCLIDSGKKKEQAMNRYLQIIGDKDAMNLSRLSLVINKSHKQVIKDLQFLIDDGCFDPDSYIDVSTNNFLRRMTASPDAPGEYYFGMEAEKRKESAGNESSRDGEFTYFLQKLREADDAIEDADVSDKIFKLEKIATSIFAYVEEHPEKRQDIRRFMNYYLPTTLKLLGTYSSIEKAGVSGKNMQAAKSDIESTLDKLVTGFQEQLDVLYEAEAIDVATDIDVLNQMMAKDGFRGDDFSSGTAAQKKDE